jgi:nucleoredoxin
MDVFSNATYVNKNGPINPSSLNSAKFIGIYFAGSWCGPCRTFTPSLINFYENSNKDQMKIEIIYVSFDKDQTDFQESLSKMPWLALEYKNPLTEALTNNFKVYGLPKLVIIETEINAVIVDSARADILEKPDTCFDKWISLKKKVGMDVWVIIKQGQPVKHMYYYLIKGSCA